MSDPEANSNAVSLGARARRNARHILALSSAVFVVLNALTIAVIMHNNGLESYPAMVDPAATLMSAGAGVLILAACWFAWTRLRPPTVHVAWIVAAMVTGYAAFSLVGVGVLRPLVNSAQYDAAVAEFGDTFVNAAKLTDEELAASKLINRVANDDAAVAADVQAAIEACDTLIKRLTDDASFLESWPQVCREIMRKHGVSDRRIEWYARRMEQENDTSELLESNAQLAMLLQARKFDLRGRLAKVEANEPTPVENDRVDGADK